jgi:hypothetical protein
MKQNNIYKIASVPKQILILNWKNFILLKRNILGTLFELACPLIFISFLLIIRYFIERIKFFNQYSQPNSGNVLELYVNSMSQQKILVLFYPNNKLIQELVENSIQFLKLKNPEFAPTSKIKQIYS